MDELRECPWCGKSDVRYFEPHNPLHVGRVVCWSCHRQILAEDAVAAWNALPRKTKWVTYDGTEETLPEQETAVIISTNGVVQRACVQRYDEYWDFGEDVVGPLKISVGDRWTPWPGEE